MPILQRWWVATNGTSCPMPMAIKLISASPPGAYANVTRYQGIPVSSPINSPPATAVDMRINVDPMEIFKILSTSAGFVPVNLHPIAVPSTTWAMATRPTGGDELAQPFIWAMAVRIIAPSKKAAGNLRHFAKKGPKVTLTPMANHSESARSKPGPSGRRPSGVSYPPNILNIKGMVRTTNNTRDACVRAMALSSPPISPPIIVISFNPPGAAEK